MREGVESYLNTKTEGRGEGLDVSYCNWGKKTVHEEKLEHKMWKKI